ncbi:MAG: nuclear transport factor 2 family protein [Armatimonadetes bacterium]|nr:nuclear transport factor 2 family protein [Armatimonadota bacterium]MBS1727679.1 nuclear transport factor 2 family protein [Armatimonadota bacterium]
MKSSAILLSGALALLSSSAFADLKSDWQKMLDKYVKLNLARDVKGLDTFILDHFASDFKFTGKSGKSLNRQQWIDQTHDEMKMTGQVTKVVFHIDSVKMMGKDKALCKTSIVFEGTVQMDPKAKPATMKATSKADQIMVKKAGKWWIQSMTNTEEGMTINGKPFKG